MMKKLIFFLILIIPILVLSQQVVPTSTKNYTQKIVYKKGFTENNVDQAANEDKIESIQYYDGLGRPIQSVAVKQGGNDKDVITHIEYDAYGRQIKDYLPIPGSNNNGTFTEINVLNDIQDYYFNAYTGEWTSNTNANPYSEKLFENSPLNRILKQAASGEDWKLGNGHEIEFDYQTNIAGEVKLYTVTLTSDYTPTLVGGIATYTANELYKNVTRDENHSSGTNHTTEEFKDKIGRVVLKRTYADVNGSSEKHDTYYVYDDYGNLTYVLPPKSEATTGIPSSTTLNELCYQYKYDSRNRLIEKRIPGKGWEYIVYNKIDQPIMTQDQNLKSQQKWMFTVYDPFGRMAYTGFVSKDWARGTMQNHINTGGYNQFVTKNNYTFNINGTNIYYDNYFTNPTYLPTSSVEILTINYYDNYTFDLPTGLSSTVTNSYGVTSTSNVKGMPTGSKVKVLGSSSWITMVIYYDDYNRPIYVYSKNDYLGTTDIVESKFIEDGYTNDIRGLVHETKTIHQKGTTDIVTINKFIYDHSGKLLSQTQNINSQGEETIAVNVYDDLGQLKRKKVGGTINNELQIVDYTYNIRGWLKQINDVNNLGTTDLFAFNINYNDIADVNKRLYNGNISQTNWNSASINDTSNPECNQYTYTYDALNRITSGIDNTGNYNLTSVTYDKNGNITNLERKGHTNVGATNFGMMDDLTYSYDSGNKLMKVADVAAIDQFGFKDDAVNGSSDTSDDYSYDTNGNLISDANKGITSILYNHLNLPTEVKFDNSSTKKINYTYTSDGVKLKKVVNDGGSLTTTDYANGYIYENNTLQFFNHPEGYVKPIEDANIPWQYVYQYKDYLGNIRLSYSDANNNGSIEVTSDPLTTEIIEENNYYPFGLKHKGYNNVVTSTNPAQDYKYNGIELEESLSLNLYEMEFRQYDPAIGKFTSIDPVTHHSMSTYIAFDNNPIYWADPRGANSQTQGAATDMWGRARYDKNGIYIAPYARGDKSSQNKILDQESPANVYVYTNNPKELKLLENNLNITDISKNDDLIASLLVNYPHVSSMTKGEIRAKLLEIILSVATLGKSVKTGRNQNDYLSEGLSFELIPIMDPMRKESEAMDNAVEYKRALKNPYDAASYVANNNLVLIFSDKRLIDSSSPLDLNVKSVNDYGSILYDSDKYPNIKYMYMGINSGNGNVFLINEFNLKN